LSSLYTSDDMASIMQRRRQLREAPAPRAGGDLVSEDYYSFSFGDTALGVPRGILSAGSDVVNLALLPFGGEVPDRFNLMAPSATIGGDITSGVTNFLTGFIPGMFIAGKLGKIGRLGKITASVDDAIATSIRAANSARKAGDLVRAANMGRKAARLGALQEITKVTTAGFFADFTVWDGHEQRLSNLLQDYTGLNDPFTSWLAAEDDDTVLGELTGRLKNAIEGAGLGLLADGVLSAFKIYRAGYKAKTKGLDPTPYMVKQAREIRISQEQELKDSFNLTDVEARVTNILIDRMGIDRSRLRIVSGQEALSIYNDATGEMLEQVAVGRRFDSREALKKVLGPGKAENHPFMLMETPELMDSIRSLGGLKKSLDSYQNINTQIETLIAFAKAGAPLQGGYEEGVKAMIEAVGTSRMQMWGLFSAATSPQNIVSAHTELGVYLMVRSAQDAFAGKKMSAKALRDYMKKTLKDEIGYSGAPVSSFTNAKKVYDTVIDRFKEAKKRAEGLNLTDEDILRTIDFEDLVTEIGGPNAMKIRGFAGGSIGSPRLNLALDTWMARLIPDDLVVPQFKDKKRTIKRGGEETTVRARIMETTLEAKKRWISSKENFVGYAAVIDQVAKRMGLTQTQVQERIWGSVVMLTALKKEGVPLEFMLNQMSREDMRSMWDLLSILSNDRIVNELKKIPHKQTKNFLRSASSVFEDIRARVRGGKPDLTREPAELVSAGAETEALEAGIRGIGVGAGTGAHTAAISRRASSGRTWAGPKYDWAAVFRAEQDKFYRKRGLPPAGTPDPTDPRSALLRSSTADRVLGFARFTDDAATIGGLRGANFETAVHELGHVARRFVFDPTVPESVRYGISESDIDAVAKYFGAARDRTGELIWSVNAEEAFTEGLIRYLRTNEPPVPGFAGVFHKVKMWLRNLFNDLDEAGGIDMPADVKAAFSKLLNRGPEDDIAGVTFGRIAPVGSRLLGGPDPEKILFSMEKETAYPITAQPWGDSGFRYTASGNEKTGRISTTISEYVEYDEDDNPIIGPKSFLIEFEAKKGYSDTGAGEPTKVLGTVANSVRMFVKNYLERTGELPTLRFSSTVGRIRAYSRMVKRLAGELGYPAPTALDDPFFSGPKGAVKKAMKTVGMDPNRSKFDIEVESPGAPVAGGRTDILRQTARGEGEEPVILRGGRPETPAAASTSPGGATGDWPGGVPSGPLPERLGRPAGNPYGRANWDAFSDSQHVSNYVKQLADDYTDIDDYVPESRAEALEFAQRDYDKLNDIIGERSSVNINEVFDNMSTSDLRRITYRLMAMRQLAADTGARIYEIASKGSSAGPDELYEFIRGRRIVEALLYEIRNQQRHIARALNFQGAVMEPNAKRIKLYPTLPKRRDTSLPPGVRQAREAVPERVTADPGTREGQGVLFPEAGSDEALADASRPVAAPVTPEAAAATPEAPATKVAEAGGPVLDEMESRAQVEAELIGRVIQDAIQSAGGRDAIYADMAKVVAAAANGGVEDAAKFIRRTTRWGQAAMEYWMNSILSGPITHAVNIASNTIVAIMLPIERALGATFRGDFATASASLKTYMYMVNNFADAMRMAALSFARDEDILEAGFRKTELEGGRAISATALGMREDSLLGKATEWVGKTLNLPSRFLAAEDEFFKQLNYRARFRTELQVEGMKRFPGDHQQAAKWAAETFDRVLEDGQAYTESVVLQRAHKKADTLKITNPAGRNRFVRAYMRDPKNWDPRLGALSRQARDESQYATFTTPLSPDSGPVTSRIAAAVQSAAQQVPAIRFLIPFIRTPTNLLNFAMARTPIANTKYLAELYKTIGKEAADPRRKSDVVGRLVFSAGIGFTAVAAASAGIITGGGPKERDRREMWEATGWRPYSIKIGDKYVSYRRFDPFSTIFGMFADAIETSNEILKNGGDPAEVDQILQTAVVMISRNITNKTYMTGITNFANALSNPKQFGQQFVNSFAASSVPYSSLLGQSIGLFSDDPAMRELESAMDAIKSRIPGLEATVPPRRNLFGEEILKNKRGLAASVGLVEENNSVYSAISTFSPFEYAEETSDELATEFRNLNHPFDRPNPIRGRNLDLREFKTDEGQQAYDRWLQLHGEVKIGGLTLRKYLTRLIRSKRYQNLSPVSTDEYQSPRVRLLRAAISRFREAAFNRLLKESTILRETYKIDFANRQALLSGRRADELMSLIR
jgi:hypothetical protein